jgi:cell volume regulation protein A
MTADEFGVVILVMGLVGTAAVLSNRLSARIRVPAPAFFLVAAAVAAELRPHAVQLPVSTVQHVVTIALAIRRPRARSPGSA